MLDGRSDMEWASAVSERVDSLTAMREVMHTVMVERTRAPDLVIVFASQHHAPAFESFAELLQGELSGATVIGCSASGVLGGGQELENREALAIAAGWLPDVRLYLRHFEGPVDSTAEAWAEELGLDPMQPSHFVLLVDPLTCEVDQLLESLGGAFPEACKVGGLAGSSAPDKPATLFANGEVHEGGALVLALQGECELRAVVSQACRPVGEPFIVTRARGNVIKELNAGRPADVLRKVYENMNARDHSLFNTSLFLGIGLGENRSRYESGDFLVRNILGIDPDSGALATDVRIDAYQVVQFHLRDPESAGEDLNKQLRELARSPVASRIRGALLFSCVGRGERLFGVANHDSDAFARHVVTTPLAGFFSAGEIGPAGGNGALLGYTSVFALFCKKA
jgi:small ligand-binding sensory domain FIST